MSTPEPGPPAWPGPAPTAPAPSAGVWATSPAPPGAPLPPYGTAPPPAWGPPPAPRGTDGLAIAAFVVALTGLVSLFTGPVGLGLGIAAQRRARRTGAPGRGLAVAATWIGGVLTVLLVGGLAVAVAVTVATAGSSSASGAPGPGAGAGADDLAGGGSATTLPWFALTDALTPGDCLAAAPATYDMSDGRVVDCTAGHTSEVVDRLAMAEPVLADVAEPDAAYTALLDRCTAAVAHLVDPAALPADAWADVYFVHPDQWAAGDRWAYCVLSTDLAATGSVLAGTFAAGPAAEV